MKTIIGICLLLVMGSVHAEISSVTGECTQLITFGSKDKSSVCHPKLVLSTSTNEITFLFGYLENDEEVVLSFVGDGLQQTHSEDGNVATQPITKVVITKQGIPQVYSATGTCIFSNPYLETKQPYTCAVDTEVGIFRGEILIDNNPPTFLSK